MKVLFGVILVATIALLILVGVDESDKQDYIKANINVGQEFIFEGSKYTTMVEQTTEWKKYKIAYGGLLFKVVFFTIKNDTIVSVWTGYSLP